MPASTTKQFMQTGYSGWAGNQDLVEADVQGLDALGMRKGRCFAITSSETSIRGRTRTRKR